jgi:arabinofuranosyltransferase
VRDTQPVGVAAGAARGVPGRGLAQQAGLVAALLVACVLLVLHARVFWRYTVDDAFISMRYARNLAEGHGLVYNPGERVEGYSNLAWTLLLAVIEATSEAPETAVKTLGVALGALALVFVLLLALEATGSAAAAAACVLLVALNPFVAVWLVAGLETGLFLFALCALAWAAAVRRPAVYGAAGALLCLTRPEGAALVGLLAVALVLSERRLSLWPFLPLAAAAGQLVFRLAYYGQWVPNTALVKVGGGWKQYEQGLLYLFEMFDDWSCLLGLLALSLAPFLLGGRPAVRAALVLSGAYVAFLVYSGGDYFALYRLAVPVMPLLTVVLAATALEAGRRLDLSRAATALSGGVLALCLVAAPVLKGEAGRERLQREIQTMDGFLRPAAHWLRHSSPPGASVALTVAGAIPYHSGLRTIDRLGLTDAEIARSEIPWQDRHYGIAKYDSASVLRRRPDWILLNLDEQTVLRFPMAEVIRRAYVPADRDLLQQRQFHEEYRLVPGWLRGSAQQFALYVRRGSPAESGLESR